MISVDNALVRRKEIVRLLHSLNGSHTGLTSAEVSVVLGEPLDVVEHDLAMLASSGEVVNVKAWRLTVEARGRA